MESMISWSDWDIPSICILQASWILLLVFSAGSETFDSLPMSSLQGSALLFLGDHKHSRLVSEQFLVVSTCSVWDSSTPNLNRFELWSMQGWSIREPFHWSVLQVECFSIMLRICRVLHHLLILLRYGKWICSPPQRWWLKWIHRVTPFTGFGRCREYKGLWRLKTLSEVIIQIGFLCLPFQRCWTGSRLLTSKRSGGIFFWSVKSYCSFDIGIVRSLHSGLRKMRGLWRSKAWRSGRQNRRGCNGCSRNSRKSQRFLTDRALYIRFHYGFNN